MYQVRHGYYKTKKCTYDGYSYMSRFEASFAAELDLMVKAKELVSWEKQVKIPLEVNGYHICNYYIDFVLHYPDGSLEYVETKGYPTEAWKLKWKLFEALYSEKPGVKLTVVKQKDNFNVPKARKIKKPLPR